MKASVFDPEEFEMVLRPVFILFKVAGFEHIFNEFNIYIYI